MLHRSKINRFYRVKFRIIDVTKTQHTQVTITRWTVFQKNDPRLTFFEICSTIYCTEIDAEIPVPSNITKRCETNQNGDLKSRPGYCARNTAKDTDGNTGGKIKWIPPPFTICPTHRNESG